MAVIPPFFYRLKSKSGNYIFIKTTALLKTPEHQQIEEKIKSEIEKTEQAIIEYKKMTQPISPENAIGRISRMDAIVSKSVVEAALRQAEEKLKQLKEVILKVDDKDFGKCAKCGKTIPLGRIL